MNIVNKVTLRHLKENKRRTLVTMIGVIISVAMITAVATLGMSFLDLNQREAIANNGDWHYSFEDVNQEQIQVIQEHENTESVSLVNKLGYAALDGDNTKPYIYIHQMNEAGMEQFQLSVKDGRLPSSPNEIAISESLLETGYKKEILDTVTLEVGNRYSLSEEMPFEEPLDQTSSIVTENGEIAEELRNTDEETFTVVGVIEEPLWDYPWSPGYTMLSYIDEEALANGETFTSFVKNKDINNALFDEIPEFAESQNLGNPEYNQRLLDTHGVSQNVGMITTIFGLLAIIIVIIMIGSIALIYNAFAISVSERSRYLGMLSSIGATKRQKRNSVFFEGLIVAFISIPLGIGAGLLGIGITLYLVSDILTGAGFDVELRLVATVGSISVAIAISFITIMISAYIPALRASKVTAIDAIRQSKDIKLTKKKVKANPLVRKIFGYEAEIALKNLKRNKKRYHVTVLSLIISIILFLSVGYFTNTLMKSYELQSNQLNYDISISSHTEHGEELEGIPKSVNEMEEVQDSIIYQQMYATALVGDHMVGDPIKSMEDPSDFVTDQGAAYTIQFIALEDQDLQAYAEQSEISIEELDENQGILINSVSYPDDEQGKYVEADVLNAQVGDSVPLVKEEYNETAMDSSFEKIMDIEIAGLTDHFPMGNFNPSVNTLFFVVSKDSFHNIIELSDYLPNPPMLYIQTDDPMKTQEGIEGLEAASEVHIANHYYFQQQDEQLALVLSIFVYGFVTLITLISVANIFNTISTSVALRRREFATMKSIGMTPKAFRKMIRFESIFYGMKSLLYGLPISIGVMYLIYHQTQNSFSYEFTLPWLYIGIAMLAVFIIVSAAMLYSISKIKNDNIIETLRQENI